MFSVKISLNTPPFTFGQLFLPNTPGRKGYGGLRMKATASQEYPNATRYVSHF